MAAAAGFTGKVAFVSGGGSGIGRATALAFAREGAQVVIADIAHAEAQATARRIEALGASALALACDVSRPDDLAKALDRTMETFGRLDSAFNNAGIFAPLRPTADLAVEAWDRVLAVNLRGVFLAMKHQIPLMLQHGGGAIVNNASVAGLIGFPGLSAYTASKHGVIGLTKAAALEYAKFNLRINAVCPGLVDTPMVDQFSAEVPGGRKQLTALEPLGRMGKPEEIAAAVLWLCSEAASFVTGHALAVDGGFVAQ